MPKPDGSPTAREQRVMAGKLTDRERDVLVMIQRFVKSHGYPPSYREIANHMGWKSTNTSWLFIDHLVEKGYLRKDHGGQHGLNAHARSIRLLKRVEEPTEPAASPQSQQDGRERLIEILKRQKAVPDDLHVVRNGANQLVLTWPDATELTIHIRGWRQAS